MTKRPPPLIAEAELVSRTGLPAAAVRAYRQDQLRRGEDWSLVSGRVMWQPEAVDSMLEALGGREAYRDTPPEEIATPEAAEVVSCIVERIYRNRRILGARRPDGMEVRVRVKDSGFFGRGEAIPCKHIEADLYEFAGRLNPKKRAQ